MKVLSTLELIRFNDVFCLYLFLPVQNGIGRVVGGEDLMEREAEVFPSGKNKLPAQFTPLSRNIARDECSF
jgi:hypothetical protein